MTTNKTLTCDLCGCTFPYDEWLALEGRPGMGLCPSCESNMNQMLDSMAPVVKACLGPEEQKQWDALSAHDKRCFVMDCVEKGLIPLPAPPAEIIHLNTPPTKH